MVMDIKVALEKMGLGDLAELFRSEGFETYDHLKETPLETAE